MHTGSSRVAKVGVVVFVLAIRTMMSRVSRSMVDNPPSRSEAPEVGMDPCQY